MQDVNFAVSILECVILLKNTLLNHQALSKKTKLCLERLRKLSFTLYQLESCFELIF